TLPYMAPEVLRGEEGDHRSDLWALGVVLYEAAAGQLPFRGRTSFEVSAAILRELLPPLPSRIPPSLWAIIQRCLAKEPAQRYQRASEVHAALEAVQSAAIANPEPPTDQRGPRTTVLRGIPHIHVKSGDVLLLVGTAKGAFLLRSTAERSSWEVGGPYFHGHAVYAMAYDGRNGRHRLSRATREKHGRSCAACLIIHIAPAGCPETEASACTPFCPTPRKTSGCMLLYQPPGFTAPTMAEALGARVTAASPSRLCPKS